MNACLKLSVIGLALLGLTARAGADIVAGSARALEALEICQAAAADPSRAHQEALLERGLTLAEEAVRADDTDPAAHFAVFCNLGRRMLLAPLRLSSFTGVRRVRREIDRALELAPDSAQMLAAKGMLLLTLPSIFGGDAREGNRLLQRAHEAAPALVNAERLRVQ